MENKIQINGVWYVREDSIAPTTNTKEQVFNPDNVTNFEACVYETDDYCWEASRIRKDDGTFYKDVHIEFKDKTVDNWRSKESEYWDGNSWLLGVLQSNPESLEEARDCMNEEGVKTFREFLGYLNDLGWLK